MKRQCDKRPSGVDGSSNRPSDEFDWLQDRLCDAINAATPSNFVCRSVGNGIEVMANGESCGTHGFRTIAVQTGLSVERSVTTAILTLLNFVQDCVTESTMDPWPAPVGAQAMGGSKLGLPEVEIREGELEWGYKADELWVLRLTSVDVSRVLPATE